MTHYPLPSSFLRPPAGDPLDQFNPAYLDEIANAIRGPAVQMVIDTRIEQILRYGHDAEYDAMQAIDALPRKAREYLIAAIEQVAGVREHRQLPAAVRNLARTAAICLAGIDRLQAVIAAEQAKQQQREER